MGELGSSPLEGLEAPFSSPLRLIQAGIILFFWWILTPLPAHLSPVFPGLIPRSLTIPVIRDRSDSEGFKRAQIPFVPPFLWNSSKIRTPYAVLRTKTQIKSTNSSLKPRIQARLPHVEGRNSSVFTSLGCFSLRPPKKTPLGESLLPLGGPMRAREVC